MHAFSEIISYFCFCFFSVHKPDVVVLGLWMVPRSFDGDWQWFCHLPRHQ